MNFKTDTTSDQRKKPPEKYQAVFFDWFLSGVATGLSLGRRVDHRNDGRLSNQV